MAAKLKISIARAVTSTLKTLAVLAWWRVTVTFSERRAQNNVAYLKSLGILFLTFTVTACETTASSFENERSKALAMASENGAVIFSIAAIPLHFYCKKSHWPAKKSFAVPPNPVLWSVRNLRYQPDHGYYLADFELKSFVPNDDFTTNWHMVIAQPDKSKNVQTVSIVLESRANNIVLPFGYEFACQTQGVDDEGNVLHDKNPA